MKLPAPAKVNLHLFITGVRANGMHELDTAFAYVDAMDELSLHPDQRLEVSCNVPGLAGEQNLVFRVLAAFREVLGTDQGLRVKVRKRLPLEAGLGGGSSDAATALMAANVLWNAHWNTDELMAFAVRYGADIPCFLFGQASCASGVGERLVPYEGPWPEGWILLAWPGSGASTASVFRHYDAHLALTPGKPLDTMRPACQLGSNDLEESAIAVNPSIGQLLQELRRRTRLAWMSGSGSACIGLFEKRYQAEKAVREMRSLGLCNWAHIGHLMRRHPVPELIKKWGVAKR
ncbi:MAG: 4-(cytidine 5'-diphospho)-2-C-methyl-D-erythritol kinase [Zetaproteobacteria bacterium]|nr:MAG: 4-(cytidine 5'-diphospho)-2-C-methyl-D-erythritol kinase [Zetaproteobacteria bacterium]